MMSCPLLSRDDMEARHIDHVNLRIPPDGVDAARTFYGERLGFGIEDEPFEAGETSFFDVRLSPTAVVHLWPTEEFEPPAPVENYNHVCIAVDDDIEAITSHLDDAGVEIETELTSPLGATGQGASVYVSDPFGYRIELKEGV